MRPTYLESKEDGVCLGTETDGCRALLDGLEGVLNLVQLPLRRL